MQKENNKNNLNCSCNLVLPSYVVVIDILMTAREGTGVLLASPQGRGA